MFPTPAIRSWVSRNAFTGARLAARDLAQVLGREVRAERLDAEPRGEVVVASIAPQQHDAGAEAALVREHDRVAVVETELDPREASIVGVEQVPGHAQVHDQVDVTRQLPDEVLAAAVEPLDPPARDRVGHLPGRRGIAPARVEDLHLPEPPPLDDRRELAANRLDLGQLRHRRRG